MGEDERYRRRIEDQAWTKPRTNSMYRNEMDFPIPLLSKKRTILACSYVLEKHGPGIVQLRHA